MAVLVLRGLVGFVAGAVTGIAIAYVFLYIVTIVQRRSRDRDAGLGDVFFFVIEVLLTLVIGGLLGGIAGAVIAVRVR